MSDFCVAGVDLGGPRFIRSWHLPGARCWLNKNSHRSGKGSAARDCPDSGERGASPKGCLPCFPPAAGLTLGAPGPLDTSRGIIHFAPNLNWHNLPIGEILQEKTGVRVLLDNDANLAALGEHFYGAGRGAENMVFITVSTGVGGGLILGEDFTGGQRTAPVKSAT